MNAPKKASIVIAVDGPAASGKGTLAKELAALFALDYLDTGLLYRAVGRKLMDANIDPSSQKEAIAFASTLSTSDLLSPHLRGEEVASYASICSGIPKVRELLLKFQTDFANNPPSGVGAVLDGRDIGTVVCPNAHLKLFITASCEERANRRYKESVSKGLTASWQEIYDAIYARDERERTRTSSPVVAAIDAHTIDTSRMSIKEVLESASSLVQKHTQLKPVASPLNTSGPTHFLAPTEPASSSASTRSFKMR